MKDNHRKKEINKRKLIVPIVLVSVLLLLSIGAFAFSMMKGKWNDGSKDEEVHHAKEYQLFWNVDGAAYMADSTNGITTREKDGAFFSVCFATGGKQETYKVVDMRLMNRIDSTDIMGLEIDEKGVVTGMLTLEEIGATVVGEQFYVASLGEKKVTLNSSTNYNGVEEVLKVTKKTSVFDVSGMSEYVGQDTSLVEGDRVLAVKNAAGDVTDIFAIQRSDRYGNEQSYCEHCQQMVYWRSWTNEIRLPFSDGHWRLDVDVKIGRQTNITADQTVVLDLNGHTAEAPVDNRLYANYEERSNLVVMDTSKEQTGRLASSGKVPSGGIVWVRYGTFTMYSGTLDGSKINSNAIGATIKAEKYTETYIYGGTIIGGTSTAGLKEDLSGITGGSGANVHVLGTVTMYDGVIRDGKAVSYYEKNTDKYRNGIGGNVTLGSTGVFNFYGGRIENGQSDCGGANVYLSGGSVLNMTGGTISGGTLNSKQKKNGGNVWVSVNSVLNMSGGVIENGKSHNAGGNMALYGTLNMSGGTIKGGTIFKDGKRDDAGRSHNIYFQKGLLNMSGGTIEGYVQVVKNTETPAVVKLSGTAQICGGSINLYLPAEETIEVTNLKKGANIYVNALGFFSKETAAGNEQYVHSDYADTDVVYAEKKLYAGQQHCICGGWHFDADGNRVEGHYGTCTGELVLWTPWNKNTTLPRESGHWYLTSDVTLSVQMNLVKGSEVYVDLNGKTVTQVSKATPLEDGKYGENKRIYSQHLGNNKLVLLDTSDTRSGKLVPIGTESVQGNCIWIANNSKCEIYAGTYDASAVTSKHNGTAIYLSKGCELSMYSGTVKGGYATKADSATKASEWRALAGSVYVDGKFSMWDTVIEGGKAAFTGGNLYVTSNGEFYMHSGKILGGVAEGGSQEDIDNKLTSGGGGNIRAAGGIIEIMGGEIRDGSSAKNGGNIYLSGAVKFTLKDGLITGGVSGESGGNVAVMSSFTMTGGTIEGGKASTTRTNNVFVNASNAEYTFSMTGGIVKGYMAVGSGCKMLMNFGGTAVVYDENTSPNLYLDKEQMLNLTGFAEGAKISVTKKGYGNTTGVDGIISTATAKEADLQYIFADDKKAEVRLTEDNKLTLYRDDVVVVTWKEWNDNTKLPTDAGNYKLTTDVTLSAQWNVPADTSIVINLNGKTITGAEGKRICSLQANSTLEIMDDQATAGKLVMNVDENETYAFQGGVVWLSGSGSKFTLNSGTLDASDFHTTNSGAAVYVAGGTTFTMTGGKILGGAVYYDSENSKTRNGGSVYVAGNGSFTMKGGTISGGQAGDAVNTSDGGNVYIAGNGSFAMSGGTIEKGSATRYGGNLYISSGVTFNMTGGTLDGGLTDTDNALMGGNMYVAAGGSVTMTGGTIKNGRATTHGGNVYLVKKSGDKIASFTMTGGSIIGGKTTVDNTGSGKAGEGGGNIYLGEGAAFTMSKDKTVSSTLSPMVSSGESAEGGGNILAVGTGATVTITDATVTGGVALTGQGGNISVRSYATLVMNDENSIVSDGEAKANSGGNIGVITANLNLTAGKISDGISTNTNVNGNIFVNNNNTANKGLFITIKGCTVGTDAIDGVAFTKMTGTTVDTDKEY